jgi:hypothetical protein
MSSRTAETAPLASFPCFATARSVTVNSPENGILAACSAEGDAPGKEFTTSTKNLVDNRIQAVLNGHRELSDNRFCTKT